MTTLLLIAFCLAIGWHLSRAYHEHRLSLDLARRAAFLVEGVYRAPVPREALHADQDCVELPPLPRPVSIQALSMDLHYGQRHRVR